MLGGMAAPSAGDENESVPVPLTGPPLGLATKLVVLACPFDWTSLMMSVAMLVQSAIALRSEAGLPAAAASCCPRLEAEPETVKAPLPVTALPAALMVPGRTSVFETRKLPTACRIALHCGTAAGVSSAAPMSGPP